MAWKHDDLSVRLETVLDICGADPARWPAAEREALLRHARADAHAGRLLVEAQALDKVMAHAPAGVTSPTLAARIVAGAVSDTAREARVVPLPVARARPAASDRPYRRRVVGPAAAMLAASFAFGVYLGAAGVGDGALDGAFGPVAASLPGSEVDPLFGPVDGVLVGQEELL